MVFLAAGFGFKMAIVPFQMWTPDVYQGAPTPVAAFLSVGSKAAAFAVVMRIFFEGFGADTLRRRRLEDPVRRARRRLDDRRQRDGAAPDEHPPPARLQLDRAGRQLPRRPGGDLRIGDGDAQLGASGVVFFLATYAFTNLGAFFAVMAISNRTGSDEIADYAGMGRRAPIPAAVLPFCLLSLTGLPPTAGFIAKIYIFNAAVQADLVWLVIIAVLNTAVSAFYYLGVARQMYMGTDAEGEPAIRTPHPARRACSSSPAPASSRSASTRSRSSKPRSARSTSSPERRVAAGAPSAGTDNNFALLNPSAGVTRPVRQLIFLLRLSAVWLTSQHGCSAGLTQGTRSAACRVRDHGAMLRGRGLRSVQVISHQRRSSAADIVHA